MTRREQVPEKMTRTPPPEGSGSPPLVDDIRPAVIGVDLGGANLKYAATTGEALECYFPMWTRWRELSDQIVADLRRFAPPPSTTLAVTMTGELADCFVDRSHGVTHLVDHTLVAAGRLGIADVRFYGVDGRFHRADAAKRASNVIAAANWHALASFVADEIDDVAMLVDVGSTTTDRIPIANRRIAYRGKTDFDRLRDGALVYVGGRRTPVCALVDELAFRGRRVPVMKEVFATIDDARIILGHQAERPEDHDTADSRPRTQAFARARLARMIGLEKRDLGDGEAVSMASQVHAAARRRIDGAAEFPESNSTGRVVLSGHCDDLVDDDTPGLLRLSHYLGAELSRSAPAYSVARLAATEFNATKVAAREAKPSER